MPEVITNENFITRKKEHILLTLILLTGVLVRVVYFGSVPGGVNQDEASMGYDAWALLNYGIDRNGYSFPVYFVSWGSGQNALYAYLVMPFIALFGLSITVIRIPALLLGVFSIYLLFLTVKQIAGLNTALAASFMLAVSPWHIMLSRWSLESNILPAFLLIAVYFYISSYNQRMRFFISGAFFGLSLYAYMPAGIVVPVLILILLIHDLYIKSRAWKDVFIFIAVFSTIALPLLLFLAVTFGLLPEFKIGPFSVPLLSAHRASMISLSAGNLKTFGNIIYKQFDGLYSNAIPEFGIMYLYSLPFAAIGIIRSAIKKEGQPRNGFVMLVWLVAALCMITLTDTNINRANSIFIPVIYFTALGILASAQWLWKFLSQFRLCARVRFNIPLAVIISVYLFSFVSFAGTYFTSYNDIISRHFFRSFDRSVEYAAAITDGDIVISAPSVNMPYIHVLFSQKIPPSDFTGTVVYKNPDAPFRAVDSFDRYSFVSPDMLEINTDTVYIYDSYYDYLFTGNGFIIETFEYYSVAYYR